MNNIIEFRPRLKRAGNDNRSPELAAWDIYMDALSPVLDGDTSIANLRAAVIAHDKWVWAFAREAG